MSVVTSAGVFTLTGTVSVDTGFDFEEADGDDAGGGSEQFDDHAAPGTLEEVEIYQQGPA